MNVIPLENTPELAKKYGIASAWVNTIEEILKITILIRHKVTQNIPLILIDLLDDQTLGGKIRLAEGLIDKKIIGKLHDLNNKRRIIAHGLSTQSIPATGKRTPPPTGLTISHKKNKVDLEELLDEIIVMCKKLSTILLAIR